MWGAGTRHRNAPERTSHSADTEDIQQEESFTVGTESWRGEQGGTECALIPLYSLAFRIPLPDTIPLLHGLTSHLTREEHIGYITATKLELGLCRSQGGKLLFQLTIGVVVVRSLSPDVCRTKCTSPVAYHEAYPQLRHQSTRVNITNQCSLMEQWRGGYPSRSSSDSRSIYQVNSSIVQGM